MIKNESIENLLATVDIVDVVEKYVPLKRSGANFVGVCPFHDDSHPSMSVSSKLGIFHCFSCKAGGNAIKFIQDYEKISFPEAVEKLAEMYNFALQYTGAKVQERSEEKKVLEILNAYYQSCLYQNPTAVKYLHDRGLSDQSIRKFGLGYAGASAQTIRVLQNEEIPPQDALNAGAVKQNERGLYASFIERITFPIYNHASKLVGFGGRTISDNPAKYVNSPQCALFDKSKIFYAFDLAKKSAIAKKTLIITEGYMDVIMLHQAGIDNAVAVLGTALTPAHLPLIKRAELNVVLSFDGDAAGINAAIKSARLLCLNKIDSSVAIIGGGADPADMIAAGKVRELEQIYASGMESGEFLIRRIAKKYDLARPVQKEAALNEIKEFTAALGPVLAESYQSLVAQILNVSPASFNLSSGGKNFGAGFEGRNFNEGGSFGSRDFGSQNFNASGDFSSYEGYSADGRGGASGSLNGGNFVRAQNTARYESSAPPAASARGGRTLLRRKEIAELQIIKSMLLDGEMAQLGLGCLERRDFRMHGDIFEAFLAFARSGGNFKNFIAGEGGNVDSASENFTADGAGENFIRSESVNLKSGESSSEQNFNGQGSASAVNLKGSVQQGANGGEKQDVNNIANQGKKKAAAQNIQNAQSVQNTQNVETEALENLRALALDDEILPIGGAALFNDACKILRRNALQDLMQKLKNSDAPDKIERILEYQKKINQLK
ncbi:DNA primase [uncultured Campylobacter sp.]|uniref:DNA primase n=1 Tax=uncultured Campylobacter sp. TaxID=218934 RepID=UPI0026215E0E|nr:DNA primase [uncultured Campylobacter sp.]